MPCDSMPLPGGGFAIVCSGRSGKPRQSEDEAILADIRAQRGSS